MAIHDATNSSRILLSGASGFLGTALLRSLVAQGHAITRLTRHVQPQQPSTLFWNPYSESPVPTSELPRLEGFQTAIHLSGDNLASGRWTPQKKKRMWESRVTTTRALAGLLAPLSSPPNLLICASAVGYYGNRSDEVLTESSPAGTGYLPELCLAWEQAADIARQRGIRVVHLRFGVVLSRQGGALAKMLPLFRLGLGGRLGTGQQWMSWIALPDLLRVVDHIRSHQEIVGAVNVVSPHPVTNAEFTRTLAHSLHRPAILPAPAFALRAAFGEMADAALLSSTRAVPAALLQSGFTFQHATLESALKSALTSALAS